MVDKAEKANKAGKADDAGEVTKLLVELREGNKAAEGRLLEVVYPELRRIAGRFLKGERAAHTLQPTALVNEAYLQLAGQMDKEWQNRSHFYAVAAQVRWRKAVRSRGGRSRAESKVFEMSCQRSAVTKSSPQS